MLPEEIDAILNMGAISNEIRTKWLEEDHYILHDVNLWMVDDEGEDLIEFQEMYTLGGDALSDTHFSRTPSVEVDWFHEGF